MIGGTVVSLVMVWTVVLPPPGWAVDPETGIPTGVLMPGYIRLLTPFFNITGAFALVLGALYSAYAFMPKVDVARRERWRLGRARRGCLGGCSPRSPRPSTSSPRCPAPWMPLSMAGSTRASRPPS